MVHVAACFTFQRLSTLPTSIDVHPTVGSRSWVVSTRRACPPGEYRFHMVPAPPIDRKQLRDSLRSHLARLASEVDSTRRNAGFHEAVRAMAMFWRYSPFNQFAIRIQRPDATLVAGRRTWEVLGRKVKPGERAIAVLAATRRSFGYVGVPVFDVRQTRGRKAPVLAATRRGRSRHVRTLERAAATLGIQVAYVAQRAGVAATSHGDRVEVDPTLPGRERVRCLAHELAHEVLHQAERARALARKRPAPILSHAQRETEAEATAYVVLAALGLEPPSPAYIAWQGGTGETVLRSLGRVQRAARRILEATGCGLLVRARRPVREGSLAERQQSAAALQ